MPVFFFSLFFFSVLSVKLLIPVGHKSQLTISTSSGTVTTASSLMAYMRTFLFRRPLNDNPRLLEMPHNNKIAQVSVKANVYGYSHAT